MSKKLDYKPYSVEWSTDNGCNIDYEEFDTLKEAEAYFQAHKNDKGKEDMNIAFWKRTTYFNDEGWEEHEWERVW